MAKRQDSGSGSAHEDQRPIAHNEDAIPEMTDTGARPEDIRSRADEDDEFEDVEDLGEAQDDEDEGTV